MSKRYLQWGYDSFKDTKTGEISDNHIHILNKQAERIAELEEQLTEVGKMIPKFKIGQTVWYIYGKNIKSFIISKIEIEIRINPLIVYSSPYIYQYEENCFATKEEAQAKLEELRGK